MDQELKSKLKNASKIYFVCSGNIIRSSFAELYAKHLGIENVESYGTTYHNSVIHENSKTELEELNVAAELLSNFTPTHIDQMNFEEMLNKSALHIVMTDKHRSQLLKRNISADNIIKLTNLIGSEQDVADPYFEGNWIEAYSTIKNAVQQINIKIS